MIIIDRHDYIKKIGNILSDQNKFTNVNLKDDTSWNFASNQKKGIEKVLKKLVESDSVTEKKKKNRKSLKG